jgi:hypothetical protein
MVNSGTWGTDSRKKPEVKNRGKVFWGGVHFFIFILRLFLRIHAYFGVDDNWYTRKKGTVSPSFDVS